MLVLGSVLVLLGACLNVAVAAACHRFSSVLPSSQRPNIYAAPFSAPVAWGHPDQFRFDIGPGLDFTSASWMRAKREPGTGWIRDSVGYKSGEPLGEGTYSTTIAGLRVVRAGVPFRSFYLMSVSDLGEEPFVNHALRGGVDLPSLRAKQLGKEVPVLPIWSGFIANTLVYAVGLAVSWVLVGAGRRCNRRAAGECRVCRYPVPSSGTCPECGTVHEPKGSALVEGPQPFGSGFVEAAE